MFDYGYKEVRYFPSISPGSGGRDDSRGERRKKDLSAFPYRILVRKMISLNIYFEVFTLFIVLLNNILYFAENRTYIYMHFIYIHIGIHLHLVKYASLHI